MNITITVALVGLLATLLGVLITTTWRLAVLTTQLTRDVKHAGEHSEKLDERIKSLDGLPELHRLVAQVSETTRENSRAVQSMRPVIAKLELHVQHLDQRIHSVKEMRSPWRGSRPDPREE
jgi:bacterioferritin (cytochrome b1)